MSESFESAIVTTSSTSNTSHLRSRTNPFSTSSSDASPMFYVRKMTNEDVQQVLDIWGENNLHEGTDTIRSFLKVDPDGFYVAVDYEDGTILGMTAGIFIHPDIAYIGLYGVRIEHQKKGIGLTLWHKMMSHIGDRNAGLYAVPEHVAMYRDKAGFAHKDSRMLFIYESGQSGVYVDDLVKRVRGCRVDEINEQMLQQVISYDQSIHGYSRAKLLPNTFSERDSVSLYALDEIDHTVVGYGCLRTNNVDKVMVGPLYADNDAVAELLFYEMIQRFPCERTVKNGLLFMTLDSNHGGITIAGKMRLVKHEELNRYFSKSVYNEADWKRVYCIHSPNFSLL